jgi:hypothetical protein
MSQTKSQSIDQPCCFSRHSGGFNASSRSTITSAETQRSVCTYTPISVAIRCRLSFLTPRGFFLAFLRIAVSPKG